MSELIWITVIILALITVLAVVAVWRCSKGPRKKMDYKTFFIMGIIWMAVGAYFMFRSGEATNGLFSLGIIFFIVGLANMGMKTKKPMQKTALYTVVAALIITMAALYIFAPV